MTDSPRISSHTLVSLQYALTTANGAVIRQAHEKPIQYVHGCGLLFRKLEAALEGRQVGEVVRAKLLADDAFGRRNPDLVHEVQRDELPPGEELQVGGTLIGHDEQGNPINFRIISLDNGVVKLDANHPLAGETLIFELEIQAVRSASEAEIEQAMRSLSPSLTGE